ncbi:MAG: class I SAM-dependent methyltransferase [Gemmatimonadaceae bacterium]|nr:class I SAM-dependent methyltransferase [Gemmatimonadaceae bacterium]
MNAGFSDHFARQAGGYAAFRPQYPVAMIASIAALAPSRARCWDVGTGNGQAALQLAVHFDEVVATDASARQLEHAVPHPRVTYRVAPAEHAPLADASVDLVTVAQALHWFDLAGFYREVQRVARPGAAIAAWSYDLLTVDDSVDAAVRWFYAERVGRYWPPERRHVESRYATLDFPFAPLPVEAPPIEAWLDRDGLVGFIGSWSALARAREGEGGDPLEEFALRLASAWPDANERRLVRWPVVALAGRVREAR